MAVRLAVTLGATTLLTIGAVTVGAATKGSDKNEITTDTAAESSDPGTSGTMPTREPVPASTSTTDSTSADVSLPPPSTTSSQPADEGGDEADAENCLYTLNSDEFDDSFDYSVSDSLNPDLLQLSARPINAFDSSELPPVCQTGAGESEAVLHFCTRADPLPQHRIDADVTRPGRGNPDYVIVEQTKGSKPLEWSIKPASIDFCDAAPEIHPAGKKGTDRRAHV